jgi:hypothetical protein
MTESTRVEAALQALYGAPLEAFIDERKRLVKELRSAGDRSAAARLAKLRKPSAAAWALNQVSREAPEVVEEWLAVGERLRDASSRPAQVGGEGVRAAITAHRAATAKLVAVLRERARPGGRPLSEDMLDRARNLLLSATTDGALAEGLRRGRITEEQTADASDAAEAPESRSQIRTEPADAATKRDAAHSAARSRLDADARRREVEARRRAEHAAELERGIRAAQAEMKRLAAEHGDRLTAAGKADARVEAARRALREAEARAAEARVAVREHEEALRAAEAGLEGLRAQRRAALS